MPYLSDDDGNTNGASDHDGKINLRDQCAANLYYVYMYIACARTCTHARTHAHTTCTLFGHNNVANLV